MRLVLAVLLVTTTACGLAHQAGSGAARGATSHVSGQMAEAREADCPQAECVARAMVKGALAELGTAEQRALLEALMRTTIQEMFAQASSPEQLAQMRAITEATVRSAVEEALAAASSPEQRAQTGSIVEAAVRGAVDEALARGPEMRAMARSAVNETMGALRDSLGDGDGPLAKSLAATAERVSASTIRGLRDELALFPECTGANRSRCVEDRVTALSRAASIGMRDGLHGIIAIPSLALAFLTGVIVALLLSLLVSHHRPRPVSSDRGAPRGAPATSH